MSTSDSAFPASLAPEAELPCSVGFIGLGLIASSLARALRESGWNGQVVGWDPDQHATTVGERLGVIDSTAPSRDGLLEQVDVVVVGAPPAATAEVLADILPLCAALPEAPVVTDLASIKGFVSRAVPGCYPFFVPGHPIAGSENSGVAAGRPDLFLGREVILTPREETSPQAVGVIEALWRAAGAWVSHMSLEDHDAVLAASSHSPHMVAYAMTLALKDKRQEPMRHGGGALRDMTRIAGSDPIMWRDVALTNRDALLEAIDEFSSAMASLRQLIDRSDSDALEHYFAECRRIRRAHDQILNPLFSQSAAGVDSA